MKKARPPSTRAVSPYRQRRPSITQARDVGRQVVGRPFEQARPSARAPFYRYTVCPFCSRNDPAGVQSVRPLQTDGDVEVVRCDICIREFTVLALGACRDPGAYVWAQVGELFVPLIGWRVTAAGALYRVPRRPCPDIDPETKRRRPAFGCHSRLAETDE